MAFETSLELALKSAPNLPARTRNWRVGRLAAVIGGSLCINAHAADESRVHFQIREYVIEGSIKVAPERLRLVVAPFTGPNETFEEIQKAVTAVQRLYADDGYSAMQVELPPQDITNGIVHLKIVEARIGKITVIGNRHFDTANIRASLPLLREGQAPNVDAIGTSARLANDSYAKQTQITFGRAEQAETIDATVRVADFSPVRHVISVDNTGTAQTGRYRIGYAFQHANLFNTDHTLTAQYVTSPDHLRDVTILALNYRIPFYSQGAAIDFSGSHANVSSGIVPTTSGSYSISGSGDVFGVKYTQLMPRVGQWDQRVTAGFDYRYYQNNVMLDGSGSSLIPSLVARPLTLGYVGLASDAEREWRADISLSQNIPGGSKNSSDAYQAPGGRAGASADFRILRYNFSLRQSLPSAWQAQIRFSGQYTEDALISGEQFGIGGVESVRGFNEREILNDRGYRTSVELQSPDIGKYMGTEDLPVRLVGFYDAGWVQRNHALPGERTNIAIASTGIGVRMALGGRAQVRLDYASVLQGGGVRQNGERQLHANLTLLF